MSRFAQLFDAITKTGAEELRLIHGEKIHILKKGGQRQDIGRDPIKSANIDPLANEALPAGEQALLASGPRTVEIEHGGNRYFVTLTKGAQGITIGIRPFSAGPPASALQDSAPSDAIELEAPTRTRQPTLAAAPAPPVSEMRLPESGRMEVAERAHFSGGGNPAGIDEILRDMIGRKASDLHLSAEEHPILRLDGEVHFMREREPLTGDQIFDLLKPVMSEKSLREFSEKNDVDFAHEVPGLARFRVNVFKDRKGVGTVIRQIPIEIIPAEKLGLPKGIMDLCYLSKGLVVVTGPTGSGKSTTLASMIDHINKNRSDHILTIEDPVEFVHNNIKCLVNQREVGVHTQSFKNALRAALREDPDIVLVGEMRDLETISIAIETAETGHLVFGTLHTTTAISTVDRIIDQFPPDRQAQIRVMLSESLKGVVAQALLKKNGGGRCAALEVLLVNNAVSSLIRDGKTFQIASIMQTSKGLGMITMNDSLFKLVQDNKVTAEDAYIKAVDKSGFKMMLQNANIPLTVV